MILLGIPIIIIMASPILTVSANVTTDVDVENTSSSVEVTTTVTSAEVTAISPDTLVPSVKIISDAEVTAVELSDNVLSKIFLIRDRQDDSYMNGLIPYADQAALVGRTELSKEGGVITQKIFVSDLIVNSYGFDETSRHFQHNEKCLSLIGQTGGDLFIVGYFTTLSPSEHSVLSRMHKYQQQHNAQILCSILPKVDQTTELSQMPIRSYHLIKTSKHLKTSPKNKTSFYQEIPTFAHISILAQLLQRLRIQRVSPLKYQTLNIDLDQVAEDIQLDMSSHLYALEHGNWKRNNTKSLLHHNALIHDAKLMQEHVQKSEKQLKFLGTLQQ